jgi:hypothetical protein
MPKLRGGFIFNADEGVSGSGGGGGGSVAILDEGVQILASATAINFVGANITAIANGSQAIVYSPPPTFVSHFNTTDGIGSCSVGNFSVTSRKVSAPTSEGTPFKIGSWTAASFQNTTNSSTLNFTTTNPCSILNNTSTDFNVTVYDADGTTVLATNSKIGISGNYTNTTSNITITISGFAANSTKYQAVLAATINIGAILPNGGRFSIKLEHVDGVDGTFTKTQNNVFYDSNNNAATLSGVTIAETLGQVVVKNLSGVSYYTTGSKFNVGIADIDYINDRSYPTTQIEVIAPNYGLAQLNLQSGNLSSWTSAFDNVNATYSNSAWDITAVNFGYVGSAAKASARPIDWIAGAYVDSSTSSIAVDTYSDNSTRIFEDFVNENKRLTSAWAAWNPNQSLLSYDGNQGLQYYQSALIYPQVDFTIYSPNSGTQPNYSTSSGNRIAYIKFYKLNQSFSSGRFVLGSHNITEADLSANDVKFEVSLDGTNYFNINSLYLGGSLSNGSGCRINDDTHGLSGATVNDSSLEFTFGTGKFTDSTTGAGPEKWGAVLKITFAGTVTGKTKSIGSINMLSWN